MPEKYWHWLAVDRRLRFGSNELVEVGKKIVFDGEPILCEQGLHASRRAIDSLQYAPGPIICRVTLGGKVVEGSDKAVAQERTVLWMADADRVLDEFESRCSEDTPRIADVYREFGATRAQLTQLGLWPAAFLAALVAARNIACTAARASSPHRKAAEFEQVWNAAHSAARDEQDRLLTAMLLSLAPEGYDDSI